MRRRPRAEAGFTLIELMIVIAVIALMSALVVLALPDPRGRVIDAAERFAARARTAHDLAIVEGRSMSIWVSPGGYGFDKRDAGRWVPMSDKPMTVSSWGADIRPVLDEARSRIIFDSTGLASAPMRVQLRRGSEAAAVVTIGADGKVSIDG
ncbi:MAG: type II secretion system protein GspH [Proteobacteria bacterium SG_bin5]|nr:GspH/FimT family pseudopilin [Sphingomonas sp.]OQW43020.1 MAG: type II secretion system protein GspH [Proteobacteria bacterium SG_bin5]